MKRSDLPTVSVLSAVNTFGFKAYHVLSQFIPPKIVAAAFSRDIGSGYLECGVSELKPWITAKGAGFMYLLTESE